MRTVLAMLLAALLSGCTALGALNRASAPQDVYELRAPAAAPVARGRPQSIDFVVEVPAASGAVDTEAILVRPTPSQVQYLPDARWSETAPVMLQSAIVEAFERSGAFRFAGRHPLSASGDIALVSNLIDFHLDIQPETGGGIVRLTLVARLVREDDAAILASRTFSAAAPAADTATPAVIAAFESASDRLVTELVGWVLVTRGIAARPG